MKCVVSYSASQQSVGYKNYFLIFVCEQFYELIANSQYKSCVIYCVVLN